MNTRTNEGEHPNMSDTVENVAAAEVVSFDPEAVFAQAQAQVAQIQKQIEHQQALKTAADAKIRDLRATLAKTERIVSAMTPRTRVVKKESDVKPAAAAPKKAASSKKAAAGAPAA